MIDMHSMSLCLKNKNNAAMNKIFDIDKNKKTLPYTTPDGFFDELEDSIWKEVKDDYLDNKRGETAVTAMPVEKAPRHARHPRRRVSIASAVAVAASIALLLIVNLWPVHHEAYTASDIDQAFSELCPDDQTFLLSVYQDDVFINE